jgi:hypothetical protein
MHSGDHVQKKELWIRKEGAKVILSLGNLSHSQVADGMRFLGRGPTDENMSETERAIE